MHSKPSNDQMGWTSTKPGHPAWYGWRTGSVNRRRPDEYRMRILLFPFRGDSGSYSKNGYIPSTRAWHLLFDGLLCRRVNIGCRLKHTATLRPWRLDNKGGQNLCYNYVGQSAYGKMMWRYNIGGMSVGTVIHLLDRRTDTVTGTLGKKN